MSVVSAADPSAVSTLLNMTVLGDKDISVCAVVGLLAINDFPIAVFFGDFYTVGPQPVSDAYKCFTVWRATAVSYGPVLGYIVIGADFYVAPFTTLFINIILIAGHCKQE